MKESRERDLKNRRKNMTRQEKLQVFCAALQGLLASGKYIEENVHGDPSAKHLNYKANEVDMDSFVETYGSPSVCFAAEEAAQIAENASKLKSVKTLLEDEESVTSF